VGYADGYPTNLGSRDDKPKGASVGVILDASRSTAPVFVPVVGAVNMDQITIDLTDVASLGRAIAPGTHVELISSDPQSPNHLTTLARMAGTIPHEMLCRLNPRIKREYVLPVAQAERPVPDAIAV